MGKAKKKPARKHMLKTKRLKSNKKSVVPAAPSASTPPETSKSKDSDSFSDSLPSLAFLKENLKLPVLDADQYVNDVVTATEKTELSTARIQSKTPTKKNFVTRNSKKAAGAAATAAIVRSNCATQKDNVGKSDPTLKERSPKKETDEMEAIINAAVAVVTQTTINASFDAAVLAIVEDQAEAAAAPVASPVRTSNADSESDINVVAELRPVTKVYLKNLTVHVEKLSEKKVKEIMTRYKKNKSLHEISERNTSSDLSKSTFETVDSPAPNDDVDLSEMDSIEILDSENEASCSTRTKRKETNRIKKKKQDDCWPERPTHMYREQLGIKIDYTENSNESEKKNKLNLPMSEKSHEKQTTIDGNSNDESLQEDENRKNKKTDSGLKTSDHKYENTNSGAELEPSSGEEWGLSSGDSSDISIQSFRRESPSSLQLRKKLVITRHRSKLGGLKSTSADKNEGRRNSSLRQSPSPKKNEDKGKSWLKQSTLDQEDEGSFPRRKEKKKSEKKRRGLKLSESDHEDSNNVLQSQISSGEEWDLSSGDFSDASKESIRKENQKNRQLRKKKPVTTRQRRHLTVRKLKFEDKNERKRKSPLKRSTNGKKNKGKQVSKFSASVREDDDIDSDLTIETHMTRLLNKRKEHSSPRSKIEAKRAKTLALREDVVRDWNPAHFIRCHASANNEIDDEDETVQVWQCCFEPSLNGKCSYRVATCGGNVVCIIDCVSGNVQQKYKHHVKISEVEDLFALTWIVEIVEKRSVIFVGGEGCRLLLLNSDPLTLLAEIQAHTQMISGVASNPLMPNMLCSGSVDGTVKLWRLVGKTVKFIEKAELGLEVFDVLFVPAEEYLVIGTENSCWGVDISLSKKSEKPKMTLVEFEHPKINDSCIIDSLTLISDTVIASKCVDHDFIYLWDIGATIESGHANKMTIQTLAVLKWRQNHQNYIRLSFCAKLNVLVCGDSEGKIWIYRLKEFLEYKKNHDLSKELIQPAVGIEWPSFKNKDLLIDDTYPSAIINCAIMCSDGRYIVVGTDKNIVCIWK